MKTEKRELQQGLGLFLENYRSSKSTFSIRSCSNPVLPAEVLVQFGGNDARFAGVVKHVFHPPLLTYRGVPVAAQLVATIVNHGLFKVLSPVSPQEASPYIDKLPEVYALLDEGLTRLGLESSKASIRMLQYPDPVSRAHEVESHEAELSSCNGRTRDANRPVQSLIAAQLPFTHAGALYGAIPQRLLEVQSSYVPKLQSAQVAAATKHLWVLSDSTGVFRSRGICAGSAECDRLGEQCPIADRVRWAYWPASSEYVFSKRSPPWGNISDFKPYDIEQRRGMRYANDALLTSARYDSKARRVRLDWLAGIAHPTALMHARIAESLEAPLPTSSR